MLTNEPMPVEDPEFADSELASGFIDREYERVCTGPDEGPAARPAINYPILNFFGGTVSSERLSHEKAAQQGGLVRWRQNTSRQKEEDRNMSRWGTPGHAHYSLPATRPSTTCSASIGMGLEDANLQSFMATGTRYKLVPMSAPVMGVSGPPAQQTTDRSPVALAGASAKMPAVAPNVTVGPATLYNYRSKSSITSTKLLSMVVNR